MTRYTFRLPDVGEGIAEAEIVAWHVKPGDVIKEDQNLVDVMTDKATVDITSPVSGTVIALHGEVGEQASIGGALVEFELEDAGETSSGSAAKQDDGPVRKPAAEKAPPKKIEAAAAKTAPLAAPATRARALELGVSLEEVKGTGPDGRITPKDLETHAVKKVGPEKGVAISAKSNDGITERKIVGLRRKIAEKMQDATRRIAHFSYVEEFDLTELEIVRKSLNEEKSETQPHLTLLPFFMRAIVLLALEFPHINARYDDEAGVLKMYEAVHIGVAAQTPNGLMTPVVHNAEMLDIWGLALELMRVAQAARDGSAKMEDLTGSTITLTSLGKLGGISTTPIVNTPEVAIVGPNKMEERAVVREGQIVIRTMMNVSSSFDHRIVDGDDAARFIQRLKRLIEHPALLFV